MLGARRQPCTELRGAVAAVICRRATSSQRSAPTLLTFVRPLRQQVLVLLISTSDHHAGQGSLHSRRLLCRLPWEVLDPQLVVPGLRGTQLAGTTVHLGKRVKGEHLEEPREPRESGAGGQTYHSPRYQRRRTASSPASPAASCSSSPASDEPAQTT